MEQDFASCWTARARWRRWRNRLRARLRRLALWASLARAIRHMNTTIYDICQVGQGYHQRYLTERSNSKLSFVYVELSALSWPTCLCTTRSMPGWHGHILTSHGVDMQTMGWCTAVLSRKRKPLRLNFKLDWPSATWRCIRRRPESLTARTGMLKAIIRTCNLTSSDIAFVPVEPNVAGRRYGSAGLFPQSVPRQ